VVGFFFCFPLRLSSNVQDGLHVLAKGVKSRWRQYLGDFEASPWWGARALQKAVGAKRYGELVSASKFFPIVTRLDTVRVSLTNEKELVKFLGNIIGPELERIPSSLQAAYLQDIVDHLHRLGHIGPKPQGSRYSLAVHHIWGEAVAL